MMANNGHHCVLLLLFEQRGQQSFCWNNKCNKLMCIGMDPCTLWYPCHFYAHGVGAVNQKTVQSQCKSGCLLVASCRTIFVALLLCSCSLFCSICLCLLIIISSAFISFCLCPYCYFVWLQSFADCPIHFVVDILVLLYPISGTITVRDYHCQGLKCNNEYIDKFDEGLSIARESHSNSIGDNWGM